MANENLENKRAGEGAASENGAAKAPAKKKKIIIVTGNSGKPRQNSNQRNAYSSGSNASGTQGSQGGARRQRPASAQGTTGTQRSQGTQSRDNRNGAGSRTRTGTAAKQPQQHKIIRPTVKPVQMEVDYHKPVQPARAVRPKTEEVKPAAQETAAVQAAPVVETKKVEAPAPEVKAAPSAATQAAPAKAETAPAKVETAAAKTEEVKPQAQAQTAPAARNNASGTAAASRTQTSGAGYNRERGQNQRSGQNRYPDRSSDRNQSQDRGSYGQQGGNRDGRNTRPGQNRYPDRSSDRNQGQNRGSYGQQGGNRDGRTARPGQGFGGRNGQQSQNRGSFGQQGGNRQGGSFDSRKRNTSNRAGDAAPFVKDAEKHRDDNKRKMNQERDKRSKKDLIYSEEDTKRKGNRPGRFIRPEKKVEAPVEEQIKTIMVPEKLTIRELAELMHMNAAEIIKKLFLAGQVMTPNSEVDYEEAEKIALDYDILCEKEQKVDVIEELLKEDEDSEESLESRPPVICVMGHVDHGKTSLLDEIRKTNVTGKEAGGITQAIGAYTVKVDGKSITFLDTPGHEAFTAMRMRGANSTDIAVLVVAADDGVMPQTVEAINHAKAAGVEIVVAVNKIDKPGANIDRVKQELTEYELIPTDWGGSTEFVPVSAKTGDGIQDLLETIVLTADILELKANPNRNARGLVLEAKLDKGRGPVANVLVQKGTLHVGDFISAGASFGKVRAMIDDKGRRVREARPSQPVEILGLSDVPGAGEVIIAHESNDQAKNYAETYKNQHKEELIEDTKMRMNLDDLFNQMKEGNLKEFNLIIKADVQGSVEALKQSLLKLSNDEVVVKVIHGGVGAITESDVTLASASNAVIIGFNVRPDAMAKATAEREGVDVRLYKVIYQAIEAVEAALKGMLAPVYEERVIGHIEVRQLFRASSIGNIAGSYVTDGVVRRGCKCRISRDGEQIYEGNLSSLKRYKDDVKEVKTGYECGLVFEGFDKMQVGDIVEAYDLVEVPRT